MSNQKQSQQVNRIENQTGIRFAPLAVFFTCLSIVLVAANSLQYDCDKDIVFYVSSGMTWFWLRFIAVSMLCLIPSVLRYQRWAMNLNLFLDVCSVVLVLLSGNGGFMPTVLQWTLVVMLILNIVVLVYENRLYRMKPQIHFSVFEIVKAISFVVFQWLNVAYTIHVTMVQNAYDVSVVRCIGRAITLVYPGKHFVTESGLSAVPFISPTLDQMLSFGLMWCVIGTLLYMTYGYLVFPRAVVYEKKAQKTVRKPAEKRKKQAVGYVVDDYSMAFDDKAVTNPISERILEKVAEEVAEETVSGEAIVEETVTQKEDTKEVAVTEEFVAEELVIAESEQESKPVEQSVKPKRKKKRKNTNQSKNKKSSESKATKEVEEAVEVAKEQAESFEQTLDTNVTNTNVTDDIVESVEEPVVEFTVESLIGVEEPVADEPVMESIEEKPKKKKRDRNKKRRNRRQRASLHPDLDALDEIADQELMKQDDPDVFSMGTIMKPTVEEVVEDIAENEEGVAELNHDYVVEMDPIKALVESLAQEVAQDAANARQGQIATHVEAVNEIVNEVSIEEPEEPVNELVTARPIEDCIRDFGRNFAASKAFDKGGKVFKAVGCEGYIPYKIVGKEAIVCGGPICSYESLPIIMKEFSDFCIEKKVSMTFVNVSKQQANLMQAQGCSLVHSGAEPRFTLKDFKLKNSTEINALKNKMKEKYGVSVSEYRYYDKRDNDLEMAMVALNDDWLDDRNSDGFTMYKRRQRDAFLPDVTDFSNCHERRYFYATNQQDELVAFIVLSPIHAMGGYSCEAGRKRSGQSRKMMELILHTAFIQLKASGAQWVSMGLMPDQQDRDYLNSRQLRWQEFVYRYYERIFACKDYSEAKPKYKASKWEDVYIVTKEYQDMKDE